MQMKTGLVMTFYAGKHQRDGLAWVGGGEGRKGGGRKSRITDSFSPEMSRKMRFRGKSGASRRIKKLNVIFRWIFVPEEGFGGSRSFGFLFECGNEMRFYFYALK